MDRLSQFKLLAGISESANDELFNAVIDIVERNILNYINHETLPVELEYTLILIAVSYYKTSGIAKSEAQETGALTRVKRGDTEWQYSTIQTSAFNLLDSNDFFGYKTALNPFRKLRW